MKVIKKTLSDVPREAAHDCSGARRLYAAHGDLQNDGFQALTYGFLPGGSTFEWHSHHGMEELMLVLKGAGVVRDHDGEYGYGPGDLFVFPANVEHEIHNPTAEEHEYVFVRMRV